MVAGSSLSCRNAKGRLRRRLEIMSGTACDVQPESIENGKPSRNVDSEVGGKYYHDSDARLS
jgi:hypothetical protein